MKESRECLNYEKNKASCPCSYEPCSRKGFCCECIRHHREKRELPACYFAPRVEKTFDRSIKKFIESCGK